MIVNGKEYNIDDLIKNIDIHSNQFETVGNMMLTKKEIEVLNRFSIDYNNFSSLRDLAMNLSFFLDENIDSDETIELENVLDSISERIYYEETKK